jgi:hypothetical protein
MVADLMFLGGIAGLMLIVFLLMGGRYEDEAPWQAGIRRWVYREQAQAQAYERPSESERVARERTEREAIEARLEEQRNVAEISDSE